MWLPAMWFEMTAQLFSFANLTFDEKKHSIKLQLRCIPAKSENLIKSRTYDLANNASDAFLVCQLFPICPESNHCSGISWLESSLGWAVKWTFLTAMWRDENLRWFSVSPKRIANEQHLDKRGGLREQQIFCEYNCKQRSKIEVKNHRQLRFVLEKLKLIRIRGSW